MHSLKSFFLIGIVLLLQFSSSTAQSSIDSLGDSLGLADKQQSTEIKIDENKRTRFALDSLILLHKTIHHKLESIPDLPKASLEQYRSALINGQERASVLRQTLLPSNTDAVDSTGMVNEAASLYFKLRTLKSRVEDRIRKHENQLIKKQAGYIWTAPLNRTTTDFSSSLMSLLKKPGIAVPLEHSQWSNLFLLLVISAGFFYWLLKNKQRVITPGSSKLLIKDLPIAETLLFLLIAVPIIAPGITSRYVEVIHFLVLLLVYWHFRKPHNAQNAGRWIGVIGLYLLLVLVNYMIMSNGAIIRVVLIALNAIALSIGFMSVKQFKKQNAYTATKKVLFFVFCFLLLLAILLNITGQINIAKTTSITAIIGVVQFFGLTTLGSMIINELKTRFEYVKNSKNLFSKINQAITLSFIQRVLFLIGILVWIRVFLINLDIAESVSSLSMAVLESPHALGSFTFTFRNLINFLIILAIVNWLQKNLESFFSNHASSGKRFDAEKDQRGSKITLIRLSLIILGFFFAVTALGISMTKLTVIVGALSVGIGLGMQNIFNNFVSGVILIFEKPFNIGDLIELGGQKGRVEKIGIRSSTLLTDQGSEIIIPNGDLLSGRVVNYTYSDDYIKTEFTLTVGPGVDVAILKALIKEEITKSDSAVQKFPITILHSAVSVSERTFKIECWIKNIYLEASFKSTILEALGNRLTDAELISLS